MDDPGEIQQDHDHKQDDHRNADDVRVVRIKLTASDVRLHDEKDQDVDEQECQYHTDMDHHPTPERSLSSVFDRVEVSIGQFVDVFELDFLELLVVDFGYLRVRERQSVPFHEQSYDEKREYRREESDDRSDHCRRIGNEFEDLLHDFLSGSSIHARTNC